jgi:FkbM family methyltransferase
VGVGTFQLMWRRALKRLSRGVVLRRRLPVEFGSAPILVSPEAMLSYWKTDLGKVDPFLLSMVHGLVRPQMTVWDIGANVGLFSFAAATIASRVIAVEADTWLASLLHRSSLLNCLPVTVVPAAVAAQLGVASLCISKDGRASNSLIGEGPAQTVIAITMDWMLERFAAPQVVKIDVEGMEYEALLGASNLLRQRPAILCEVTRNHDAVGELLRAADYTLYAARAAQRTQLQRPSIETLALPRELTTHS